MPKLSLSEIARFNNPSYYSKNFQKCIEEFKDDISRLYTSGYSYNEVLNNRTIKNIHSSLSRKYPGKDSKSRFPFLKRFVDFVYTRDEIFNPFGKWLHFDYMAPLEILEFVDFITQDSQRQRLSYSNLASLVFVLLQYNNISSKNEILRERGRLQRKMLRSPLSPDDRNVWRMLQDEGLIFTRVTIFNKPNYLYGLTGIALSNGYRTFEQNCKLLNIKCGFIKRNNRGYKSAVIVSGINKLRERYYNFQTQNNSKYLSMYNQLENKAESGIIIPSQVQEMIVQYYSTVLIRDKKFPSSKYLNNNPFIRISLYKDKLYCHIQSEFYMFESLLGSLYFNNNEVRRTLKKPLSKELSSGIKDILMNNSTGLTTEELSDKLISSRICLKPKCITSPTLKTNDHFNQIDDSRNIIDEISRNGIMIDLKAVERYRKSLTIKNTVTNNTEAVELSDNETFIYEEGDEINLFPEQEKTLSVKETIEELDKLKGTVWRVATTNSKVGKIYGVFTPHGASTHRMTSHKANIQGINKEIKRKVMIAREGFCLLSADVSGQDITVAANLAHKLYLNSGIFKTDYTDSFTDLNEKIVNTLTLLGDKTSNIGKPIDYIKDQIISEMNKHDLLSGWTEDIIRNTIKKAVYTFFYGGGEESFLNSEFPTKWIRTGLTELIDACYQFEMSVRVDHGLNSKRRFMRKSFMSSDFDLSIENVELFLQHFRINYIPTLELLARNNEDAEAYYHVTMENYNKLYQEYTWFSGLIRKRKALSYIFYKMKEVIGLSYLGILESFEYYNKYYEEYQLTYPSFLGWQTVVSLVYEYDKVLTKSKSYPVQAAGAEFIRQWLIELKRSVPVDLQGNGTFKIVNAIHDQVVVEVEMKHKDIASKHILDSARIACTAIGIAPETLHIPEVKQLYP